MGARAETNKQFKKMIAIIQARPDDIALDVTVGVIIFTRYILSIELMGFVGRSNLRCERSKTSD